MMAKDRTWRMLNGGFGVLCIITVGIGFVVSAADAWFKWREPESTARMPAGTFSGSLRVVDVILGKAGTPNAVAIEIASGEGGETLALHRVELAGAMARDALAQVRRDLPVPGETPLRANVVVDASGKVTSLSIVRE